MSKQRISSGVKALLNDKGGEFTAGFMDAQLGIALSYMPKTKQKEFIAQFESTVGSVVTVQVKSLGNGAMVNLPWHMVGSVCDPSTERYWSM
jgi:putative transposon-encoded protein